MLFKAYARSDGALVLVPDCLVASRDAQARHGPLVLIGRVDASQHPDAEVWRRVLSDIDRQSYAVVRRDTSESLIRPVPADMLS